MKLSLYGKSHVRSILASQHVSTHFFSSIAQDRLYRRISPIGDPNISVTPVLDQWVRQGNSVTKSELQLIIKELRIYKRFKHALEDVEKAEVTFKKLTDIVVMRSPLVFNILMNLYLQTGNNEKLDALMSEMESKGIPFDQYTFSIRLTAFAANSDIEGMDKILERMELNEEVAPDWNTYGIAADGYLKAGQVEKAMTMLKKLEERITEKTKSIALDTLLKFYARTGNKEELYRIWKLYEKRDKIYNKGYMSMISSLLMLDDIEAAEMIFKEWESRNLSYDFRVPNILINAYCRKNLLAKAESLIDHAITKGSEPSVDAWYSLASGYLEDNHIPMAKEAMKKAILVCPLGWKPSKETLTTFLEYLEGKGDQSKAEEFVELLRTESIFSPVVHNRLLTYIKGGKSQSDVLIGTPSAGTIRWPMRCFLKFYDDVEDVRTGVGLFVMLEFEFVLLLNLHGLKGL
ncbi:unnamed protein product [Dovyalis caffra]|uniref:Pentatricopeptide repeat-containing protein n=1 Tax=Dovyalis caffra TaxID=77055 RepID=A0AAV1SK26_9ROSI|nr:unnamed protein product [Dovyalis caffra]